MKKENLRENMTDLELVLTMLSEATTTEISKKEKPMNFQENLKVARSGGEIAGDTRRALNSGRGHSGNISKCQRIKTAYNRCDRRCGGAAGAGRRGKENE